VANSVCIVTNEVFPIDKGGIGRLTYNFAVNNAGAVHAADLHLLLPAKLRAQSRIVESAFEGLATIHYCPETLESFGSLGRLMQASGAKEALNSHMIESFRYYAGLVDAQNSIGHEFDLVEFPDFGGWSVVSIAARRAGVAFQSTRFVVRLHSSLGLIVDNEPFAHEPSDWMAAICDLEYQGLRDADMAVAHLPSIAELNSKRFASPAEWLKKIRVEMPPIVLSEEETAAFAEHREREELPAPPRNFLFSARLQPFKRPDLFIRAAVRFLDEHQDADNVFQISSYGWDDNYIDWLKRLVPERCERSILFLEGPTQRERADLILDNILVIPSDFESCCLLAYEGRMLGVKLILNRKCLAFGAEPTRWREGQDCLFFEGDFISLASAMEQALQWTPEPAQPLPRAVPYWESPLDALFGPAPEKPVPLSLGVIVYGATDLDELARQLQELESCGAFSDILALVPRDAFIAASVPVAAWQQMLGVRLHVTSWLEPTATEVQHAVSQLETEAVAFLPMGMRVEGQLWSLARAKLSAEPAAAVFTSHVILENSIGSLRFVLNYGDAPTVALMADRIAHRASVFRRDRLLEFGMRELAGERWLEDLCVRLVNAGHRVLVAPAALAFDKGTQRHSRIASSRFFGTHRDEAGRRNGATYRQASADKGYIDSVLAVDHDAWVLRQRQATKEMVNASRLAAEAFHFEEVLLKNLSDNGSEDYRELEIVLRGVAVGRLSISWLSFKLSEYHGQAQLEFREGGNARHFFDDWPPPTSDEWGPVAVLRNGPARHPQGVFFEQISQQSGKRLNLLLENLPGLIGLLPLTDEHRAHWEKVAGLLVGISQHQRQQTSPVTPLGRLGQLAWRRLKASGRFRKVASRVIRALRSNAVG
jgi:glycosyltransferase involved in cell wall biosynthesis